MENSQYHSRFIEKAPTINMKKGEMIAFVSKHDIQIPNPISTKSVLLEKILQKILKNSMPLILYLKKLAILFYGCHYFVAYWIP